MDFPRDQVFIFKDCVPQELVSEILNLANVYASAPNYWISKDRLESMDALSTPAELAIKYLYNSAAKYSLPSGFKGAEWWVQVYEEGTGLSFHFDKDEHLLKTQKIVKHPDYSSILYLTGDDGDRLRQEGCTVILDQRLDVESNVAFPDPPTGCVFVPPSKGKYCLFDGRLGHGVLDSSSQTRRATLLINWWTEKPQEVNALAKKDLDGMVINPGNWTKDIPFSALSRALPTEFPGIRIPTGDEDVNECGILVDDLFDEYLVDLFGENAAQAINVYCKGYILYPIDPAKTKQDISKKLSVPAAFVPEGVDYIKERKGNIGMFLYPPEMQRDKYFKTDIYQLGVTSPDSTHYLMIVYSIKGGKHQI